MARATIIIGLLFISLLLPAHVSARSAVTPGSFSGAKRSIDGPRPSNRLMKLSVLVRERVLEEEQKELLSSLGIENAPRTIQLRTLQLRKSK